MLGCQSGGQGIELLLGLGISNYLCFDFQVTMRPN